MLRSLLDRHVVAVGSSSVRLLRHTLRRARPAVLACVPLQTTGEQASETVVVALEQVLKECPNVKRITVVLQNDCVAYATVPWTDMKLRGDELLDISSIRLQERYGSRVATWTVRYYQEYGRHGLACAVSQELIGNLERFCRSAGVAIQEVRPGLAEVLTRVRVPRSQKNWLAVDSTAEGCLLAAHNGSGWSSIRFVRYSDMADASLPSLLRRECFLLDVDESLPVALCDDQGTRRTTVAALAEDSSHA